MSKMERSGIRVKGHRGTWYVIDETTINGHEVFLLESEQYGDEAACIIISETEVFEDGSYDVLLDDVWNGFDDMFEDADFCPEKYQWNEDEVL